MRCGDDRTSAGEEGEFRGFELQLHVMGKQKKPSLLESIFL